MKSRKISGGNEVFFVNQLENNDTSGNKKVPCTVNI